MRHLKWFQHQQFTSPGLNTRVHSVTTYDPTLQCFSLEAAARVSLLLILLV